MFDDPRIIPIDYGTTVGDLLRKTGDAERVIIVNTPLDPTGSPTLLELAVGLERNGFEQVDERVHEVTQVLTFERSSP